MDSLILQIIVGTIVGLMAGYVGSFMVLRRMSLVGDALSHVALPGIAVALIFNFNPFFGAFAALTLSIIGIWLLERHTELPSETLVGILFTSSLALGLLLTPEPELLEALFGNISQIGIFDFILTVILSAVTLLIIGTIRKDLTLGIVSKDLVKSMGVSIDKVNFLFLFLVAIIVALGLKVAGTLLMGSLVIIPAAAARNISLGMNSYITSASIIGAASALVGIILANSLGFAAGPIVVLVSGIVFLITLVFKR